MRADEFYMCEEDNVFDELSALYEEIKACPYADAPGLDLDLEWAEEDYYLDLLSDSLDAEIEEDYGSDRVDVQRGDIIIAEVYQEGRNINLEHRVRPFVVTYATMNYAYGFQITHANPSSLANYRVEIPDYASCGLRQPSAFMVNMVRGVAIQRIHYKIGHITEESKRALLAKLFEIKENRDGVYTDCALNDRIDYTIENVERIVC
jgi:hypothetical protein